MEIGWRGLLRLHNFQHSLDLSQAVFAASCRDSNLMIAALNGLLPTPLRLPIETPTAGSSEVRLERRLDACARAIPVARGCPEPAARPSRVRRPVVRTFQGDRECGPAFGIRRNHSATWRRAASPVSAVPHEPAADHRAGPAHSTPAVDVDRLAVLQGVVDSVQGRGHLLRTARNAQIPYRAALVLNAQAAALSLPLGSWRVRRQDGRVTGSSRRSGLFRHRASERVSHRTRWRSSGRDTRPPRIVPESPVAVGNRGLARLVRHGRI